MVLGSAKLRSPTTAFFLYDTPPSTHRTERRRPPQNVQQWSEQLLVQATAPASLPAPARGRRRRRCRRRRLEHRHQGRLPLRLEETGLHTPRRSCRLCGAIGSGGGGAILGLVVLGGGRRSLLLLLLLLLLVVGEPHREGVERRDLFFFSILIVGRIGGNEGSITRHTQS